MGKLTREFEALQAIKQLGINVIPHRLVAVKHPDTGEIVWGLIKRKTSGVFVDIADDRNTAEKLLAQVKTPQAAPEAVHNLKSDIDEIIKAFDAGFKITDLRGIVQPDGHFVVADPGEFGAGNIFAGEYIGQSKIVVESKVQKTKVKLYKAQLLLKMQTLLF
jgi:hypothetical protein